MNKRFLFFFVIAMALVFVQRLLLSKAETRSVEDELKIRKIVIDAGHGGKDPGCNGYSKTTYEKDIALAIALRLGKIISEKIEDVEVIYTRKTDEFIPLDKRAEIANQNRADFFICIHCNSGKKNFYGAETYVMGMHKSEDNLAVSKRENSSILLEDNYQLKYDGFDPKSPDANIIFSMYQNAYLDQSLELAAKIQSEFEHGSKRHNRGVKQAGFVVLFKTTMPSVLIETGFLSNSAEEKFLASEKGQDQIATAIFKAYRDYKTEMEGVPLTYKPKNIPNKNEEITFKVQILTSSQAISLDSPQFDSIREAGIEEYVTDGWFKYTIGNMKDLKEAYQMKTLAQGKGFQSAFVVAFSKGIRIPLQDALKMTQSQ